MHKIQDFIVQFLGECLETFATAGYDWFIVVGVIGLTLYIFGWKKGKDIATIMPALYVIINILAKVILYAK